MNKGQLFFISLALAISIAVGIPASVHTLFSFFPSLRNTISELFGSYLFIIEPVFYWICIITGFIAFFVRYSSDFPKPQVSFINENKFWFGAILLIIIGFGAGFFVCYMWKDCTCKPTAETINTPPESVSDTLSPDSSQTKTIIISDHSDSKKKKIKKKDRVPEPVKININNGDIIEAEKLISNPEGYKFSLNQRFLYIYHSPYPKSMSNIKNSELSKWNQKIKNTLNLLAKSSGSTIKDSVVYNSHFNKHKIRFERQ